MRGCACRGTMGLAHLSCLVRQAEMSVKEIEEWGTGEGIRKWEKCFDCGQNFHGAVQLALGWACWKTYLGRPESDRYRSNAMGILGESLRESRPEEALQVLEAGLAVSRRHWSWDEASILTIQMNIAGCLERLARQDEALGILREIHERRVALHGNLHEATVLAASNLSFGMVNCGRFAEAKQFLRKQEPIARSAMGADHSFTLICSQNLAGVLQVDDATRAELVEAVAILEDVVRRRKRVLGATHPDTRFSEKSLVCVRERLARAEV